MSARQTIGAVLRAAFAKATVSPPEREARASIDRLQAVASERIEQNAVRFEDTLRRVTEAAGR